MTVPNETNEADSTTTGPDAEVDTDAEETTEGEGTEDAEGDEKESEGTTPPALTLEQAIDALSNTRTEAKNYRLKLREVEAKLADTKTPDEVKALVAGLTADRETATRNLIVENVALSYKLPVALAARLQGSTREELEADAKVLASLIPSQEQDDPETYDGGLNPGRGDNTPDDPGALARRVNRGRRSAKR